MSVLLLLLLLGAAVCFGYAAFVRVQATRVNFVALGLFLWVLVPLLQMLVGFDA